MAEIRRSKQRDAIYQELSSRKDHPTAEDLYASLKPVMPNLSLATVYRNLRMMVKHGMIITIHTETSDHFDADIHPHYHLHCNECQKIYDLDTPVFPEIHEFAESYEDGEITSYSLIFNGICAECKNS